MTTATQTPEQAAMPEMCFYVPGATTIIDTASPEGVSRCYGQTLGQIRERYHGAQFMSFDWACELVEKAQADKYKVGECREIDEERFIYALEVLPPRNWQRGQGCESFQMSELTCGRITACYIRIGKRFYECYAYTDTPHWQLVAWATMKRNADHPEEFVAEQAAQG